MLPVGPDVAQTGLERAFAAGEGGLELAPDPLALAGIIASPHGIDVERSVLGEAQQAVEVRGAGDLVRDQIDVPDAHASGFQGDPQPLGAAALGFLEIAPRRDVLDGAEVAHGARLTVGLLEDRFAEPQEPADRAVRVDHAILEGLARAHLRIQGGAGPRLDVGSVVGMDGRVDPLGRERIRLGDPEDLPGPAGVGHPPGGHVLIPDADSGCFGGEFEPGSLVSELRLRGRLRAGVLLDAQPVPLAADVHGADARARGELRAVAAAVAPRPVPAPPPLQLGHHLGHDARVLLGRISVLHRDVPADQLARPVAEQPVQSRVGVNDRAVLARQRHPLGHAVEKNTGEAGGVAKLEMSERSKKRCVHRGPWRPEAAPPGQRPASATMPLAERP
jgi:hypothetical protein